MDSNALYTAIDAHFLSPDALRRAALLARHGRAAAEGWFKVEMIALLDSLAKDGTIDDWRSDYPITEEGKQRCDFRIVIGGKPLWLEVKTLIDPARQASDMGFIGKRAGFARPGPRRPAVRSPSPLTGAMVRAAGDIRPSHRPPRLRRAVTHRRLPGRPLRV
jgi:hypothetical protein